jgi:hypothetical protein
MRICGSLTLDQQQAKICSRVAEAKSIFLCYNVGLKSCPELAERFPKLEKRAAWLAMLVEFTFAPFLQPSEVVTSLGWYFKSVHFVFCSGYYSSWRSGLWRNDESRCKNFWQIEDPFEVRYQWLMATWEAEIERISVWDQTKQIVHETSISKITREKDPFEFHSLGVLICNNSLHRNAMWKSQWWNKYLETPCARFLLSAGYTKGYIGETWNNFLSSAKDCVLWVAWQVVELDLPWDSHTQSIISCG